MIVSEKIVKKKAPVEKEKKVKLAMWDFGHCDAKRCTGKKLERFGLIKSLNIKVPFRGMGMTFSH